MVPALWLLPFNDVTRRLVTQYSRTPEAALGPEKPQRTGSPGSEPGDDTASGEAARNHAIAPRCLSKLSDQASMTEAARRRAVRSTMSGKGCRQYPGLKENEGVGEHVRTRFQMSPKAACGIAEPF